MLVSKDLMEMSQMDIRNVDAAALVEASSVIIDDTLPVNRRIAGFMEQIKNPYCFLCDGTKVQIEFAADAKPLSEKVADYFIGLKNR